MKDKIELTPCECGGAIQVTRHCDLASGAYSVGCQSCGRETDRMNQLFPAIKMWNILKPHPRSTLEQVAPYATKAEVEELRKLIGKLAAQVALFTEAVDIAYIDFGKTLRLFQKAMRESSQEHGSKEAEQCES